MYKIDEAIAAVVAGERVVGAAKRFEIPLNRLYEALRENVAPELWKYKNRAPSSKEAERVAYWRQVRHDREFFGTLEATAKHWGVSRQRVHQIIKKLEAWEAANVK